MEALRCVDRVGNSLDASLYWQWHWTVIKSVPVGKGWQLFVTFLFENLSNRSCHPQLISFNLFKIPVQQNLQSNAHSVATDESLFQGPTNLPNDALTKLREIWLLPIYLLVSHKTKSPAVTHRRRNWIRFNKSELEKLEWKITCEKYLNVFLAKTRDTKRHQRLNFARCYIAQIVKRINLNLLARSWKIISNLYSFIFNYKTNVSWSQLESVVSIYAYLKPSRFNSGRVETRRKFNINLWLINI